MLPENRLLIATEDAQKLGVKDRSIVAVESLDGKTSLKISAQVIPGLRPGVVAMASGFGYTQSGAGAQDVDGVTRKPDKPRAAGINPSLFRSSGDGPMRVTVKSV